MKPRKRINIKKIIENKLISDLNYDLGISVGGIIVNRYLPTLSTDMYNTDTIIQISEEETKIWEEKEKKYNSFPYKKTPEQEEAQTRLFYENRKWYHILEEKYLPETIDVRITKIHPTNIKTFGEGIEEALWDCDFSHYKISEGFFEEGHKYAWCSTITLTRHIEKIPEKYL